MLLPKMNPLEALFALILTIFTCGLALFSWLIVIDIVNGEVGLGTCVSGVLVGFCAFHLWDMLRD